MVTPPKYNNHRLISLAAAIIVFAVLPVLIFYLTWVALIKITYGAWILIFLMVFGYSLFAGFWLKKLILKLAMFHIAAMFFAFMLFEGYLEVWFQKNIIGGDTITSGACAEPEYYSVHPYLGYGPGADGVFDCRKTAKNGEILYDVSYKRIGGQRHTPNSNSESNHTALFFGCSFTFGEGLSDYATIPYEFNVLTQEYYRVLNFGFHGYGPHHMLANIQNRVVTDLTDPTGERIGIYTFIPDHVKRAAGKTPWGRSGPKYGLVDGELKYLGNFNYQSPEYRGASNTMRRIMTALMKSRMFFKLFISGDTTKADIDTTVAIISESRKLLADTGTPFYMIIWDFNHIGYGFSTAEDFEYFISELRNEEIPLILLSDVIDADKLQDYVIHPLDTHPNGQANQKIARALFDFVYRNGKTGLASFLQIR